MTLPFERKRAVTNTEQFLKDLLDPQKTPRVPRIGKISVKYTRLARITRNQYLRSSQILLSYN